MIAWAGSFAMKRPMPSFIDDEVVMGVCWSADTGATIADDAGGGTSIIAMDKEETLLCRLRGLTKPDTHAATDKKDRTSRQEFFMMG
mmetsp:Transcript_20455/g.33177  ORF Transcript_20455/g.33177 Transcript_20455/m.33177 type:complete len:87 (+) Transcript_20455:457-717(+)